MIPSPATRFAIALGLGAALALASATCGGEKATHPTPIGASAALVFSVQPANATAGAALSPAVQVTVEDSQGAPVASPEQSIQIALTAGTGTAGAHLRGALTATTVNGVATFSSLSVDSVGAAYTLTASATGLSVVSSGFGVSAAPAARLAFVGQPTSAIAGASLSPAVGVAVRDSVGNAVSSAASSIRVAITSGTGTAGAALSGTLTKAASSGVATYGDLSIDKAGAGYTLTASSPGLTSAASSAFAITAGAAASVAKQAGDGQTAAVGAAVATPPSVVVKDVFGNVKSGVAVTFAVASGGGSVSGASQTTNASGIAAVGSWTLGSAGTNTLTVTVAGSGISGNPVTFTATAGSGGATLLFAEGFEDANLSSRGWYDLPSGGIASITTAQHIPGSTASLEIDFSQGGVTPSPMVAARHLFTPSDAVYLRYWVKYSANWVGSGHPYHPHEFYFFTTDDPAYLSPAYNHLTVYVEHNYQNGGLAVLKTQDAANIDETRVGQDLTNVTENRATSGCNGNSDGYVTACYTSGSVHENEKDWISAQPVFQPNPGPGYKGDWHQVEVYFKLNSIVNGIGQLDGVAQYWFDGTLVIDHHNVLFRTGAHPTMQFNQFFIGPYIGDGSPVAQQAWVDDLVVMTARP